jgi:uncharacterized membrane protein YdjX (TVP38/TMEM64 family)
MAVSRATRRQVVSLAVLAAALGAVALVFSPGTILSSLSSLSKRPLLFVAVLFGLYLVRPFVMWPVSVLSITAGYVLGLPWGIPVAIAGTLVSNTIPFLIARHARSEQGVLGFASRTSDRYVEMTGEFRGVVAARLSPLPADAVSPAAGLSEVSLGAYLLGTLVGESPWIAAEVIAGSSMHALSVHGLSHSLALFAGATALSGLLLAGPLYRRFARPGGAVDDGA